MNCSYFSNDLDVNRPRQTSSQLMLQNASKTFVSRHELLYTIQPGVIELSTIILIYNIERKPLKN